MIHLIAAAAAEPSGAAAFFFQLFPLLLIFIIFYMLLIRPQQKKMREHQAELAAVKKGDRVITGGGLIGKVTKVMDDEVEVDLGGGLKVRSVKSMLASVTDKTAKPAND
ncbi:preprotein translocase subunit YajC [Sphingomicrobium arenosum]|uniref:preprotein translocase subunit YajC n=1 Tax=Sphingomicrobium arenosum TaxID=2233861 RepID=UPI002240FAFB|nr:preprotein translocase subunit YajC [Sphingomicrobium arenosum]